MFVCIYIYIYPKRSKAAIPATAPLKKVTKQLSRGPKCIHVGSKNEARRGAPSTFRGHFRGF